MHNIHFGFTLSYYFLKKRHQKKLKVLFFSDRADWRGEEKKTTTHSYSYSDGTCTAVPAEQWRNPIFDQIDVDVELMRLTAVTAVTAGVAVGVTAAGYPYQNIDQHTNYLVAVGTVVVAAADDDTDLVVGKAMVATLDTVEKYQNLVY